MIPAVHKHYLIPGFIGALLINALLFGSLPGLIHMDKQDQDVESLNAIQFTRLKHQPPPPKTKKKPKPEKKEDKPKPLKVSRPKANQVPRKQLSLDMPQPDLNMDTRLTGGIPMVAPPEVLPQGPTLDLSGILDENQVDVIPAPTYKRNPQYPYRARRMGLEGEVKIQFTVDPEGLVSDIVILDANPPDVFNEAVMDAVSSWQYSPGELAGQKVTCRVTTTVVFKMEAN